MEYKPLLRSLVPEDLDALVAEQGWPGYRSGQLAGWLFAQDIQRWDAMTNVPADIRNHLQEHYDLCGLELAERLVAADATRKYLFRLRDGQTVESVLIPMRDHATFCISTQVGCAMACRFCATARGGLVRDLSSAEIIEQVLHLREDARREPVPGLGDRQFNVVFMGMGEPLDNWTEVERSLKAMMDPRALGMSRRRIQISTSGPKEGLEKLIAAAPGVGLTLSLGGSTDQERKAVMPVPGRTTLAEATGLAADYAALSGRRVTLAWVLIAGSTDDPEQAVRVAALAKGRPFKVNLIPLNPLDDADLVAPAGQATLAFQKVLASAGVDAFIRASGGQDIAAACGQLRRRRMAP